MSGSLAVPTDTAALGTCDKYCPEAEQSCWISGRALPGCPVKGLWVLDDDENVAQSEMVKLEFVNQYYWFTSVTKTRKGSVLLSCAAQPVGATQTYSEVAEKGEVFSIPWLKYNSCVSCVSTHLLQLCDFLLEILPGMAVFLSWCLWQQDNPCAALMEA